MTARCVRCGRGDRADGTFLCTPCLHNPRALREREVAERLARRRGVDPRVEVVARYHWFGGWPRARA